MLPETPELDILNAQVAALREIRAGDDWHSDLGAAVYRGSPPGGDIPTLHCWPDETVTTVEQGSGYGEFAVTWAAIVPVTGLDDATPWNVLADMRAALVADCASLQGDESGGTTVSTREHGSNQRLVQITITEDFVVSGRRHAD